MEFVIIILHFSSNVSKGNLVTPTWLNLALLRIMFKKTPKNKNQNIPLVERKYQSRYIQLKKEQLGLFRSKLLANLKSILLINRFSSLNVVL